MTFIEKSIVALIGLIIVGFLALTPMYAYLTDRQVTFTVEEKERIVKSDSSKYLIFTNNGVYENTDSLWYWKWRSSDVYNDLEVGETYEAKVYGWRVGFLSWYPNIVLLDLNKS